MFYKSVFSRDSQYVKMKTQELVIHTFGSLGLYRWLYGYRIWYTSVGTQCFNSRNHQKSANLSFLRWDERERDTHTDFSVGLQLASLVYAVVNNKRDPDSKWLKASTHTPEHLICTSSRFLVWQTYIPLLYKKESVVDAVINLLIKRRVVGI